MSINLAIRFMITTKVANRDMYGNCYQFTHIIATKTGKCIQLRSTLGSDGGNVKFDLKGWGIEWGEMHYTESFLKIRDWNRADKSRSDVYDGALTKDMVLALES